MWFFNTSSLTSALRKFERSPLMFKVAIEKAIVWNFEKRHPSIGRVMDTVVSVLSKPTSFDETFVAQSCQTARTEGAAALQR